VDVTRRVLPALLAFGGPLALYVASISPAVARWDTAELQTVPYILGIAHPTGFPVFVGAGYVVSHFLPLSTIAWRISFMSAVGAAVAAAAVYRALRLFAMPPGVALGAAWLYAVGDVVWVRAARAETHDLLVMFAALAICEAVRFDLGAKPGALVLTWLFWGLATATHPLGVLLVPGLLVLSVPAAMLLRRRWFAAAAAAAGVPLLAYAYLPLRSRYVTSHHLDPTAHLGLPPGQPFWDYGHTADPANLVTYLTGANSGADVGGGFDAMVHLSKYLDHAWRFGELVVGQVGWPAGVAALFGLACLFRERKHVAVGLALAAFACVPFGLSYRGESDASRYMLTALWAVVIFAAIGFQRASEAYLRAVAGNAAALAALALFVCTGAVLLSNRANLSRRADPGNAPLIADVRRLTPDGAVLVAPWLSATSLAYAAYAERTLGTRIVVTGWPLEYAARYPGWRERGRRVFLVDEPFAPFTNCRVATLAGDVSEIVPRAGARACIGGV
jgi:hypothetical protein